MTFPPTFKVHRRGDVCFCLCRPLYFLPIDKASGDPRILSSQLSSTAQVERVPGMTYVEKRVPSYCDRILWRSLPGAAGDIKMMKFDSLRSISTSDHKPVSGLLQVTLPNRVLCVCRRGRPWQLFLLLHMRFC